MGVFRSHLKQGGPSDVNPETEVTSNFYGWKDTAVSCCECRIHVDRSRLFSFTS
jgi:hypothetical protein